MPCTIDLGSGISLKLDDETGANFLKMKKHSGIDKEDRLLDWAIAIGAFVGAQIPKGYTGEVIFTVDGKCQVRNVKKIAVSIEELPENVVPLKKD